MNRDNEYVQIDLIKVMQGLLRRAWIIAAATIICGGMLLAYAALFVTPKFEASVLMYVNNSSFSVGSTNFSISSSEISAAKSLVDTYMVILKTRTTLNDVIELGGLGYTYDELSRMIKAESLNDTEVFSITVKNNSPQMAEHIANTIAKVLPEKIADVVEGSSVRIVDYAVTPDQKVSPSLAKYTLLGMLLGMFLSCAVIAVMEIADDRIRKEDYLLENFKDIPLLAVIPDMMEERQRDQYYYEQPLKARTRKKNVKGAGEDVQHPKA